MGSVSFFNINEVPSSDFPRWRNALFQLWHMVKAPRLQYCTRTHHRLEEYFYFLGLIHVSHFIISLVSDKSAVDLLNDVVFLCVASTSLFFISFPNTLVEPRTKVAPWHTDSVVYVLSFLLPLFILVIGEDFRTDYVFSRRFIVGWSSKTWILFSVNIVLVFPFLGWNLWMAWLHNEVWMHILGYVCFFSLFVACFFSRVITVHVHHWVWSGSLACFSRFSSGFSRFFHAVCLGIFVHGVSFYGGDPIFSS